MVNNFEQIKKLLHFRSEDDFYFLQILKRKKEHKELGSNSQAINTYYIKSSDHLEALKKEIILLCTHHNARACINLNRRSFEKCAFQLLQKVTNIIMNKDFKSCRQAYDSVCGCYSNEGEEKKWIIDIDETGRKANELILNIEYCIDQYRPEGKKLIAIIGTKNGVHLITKPFDLQAFKQDYSNIDVHKDNPTILFCP